MLALVWSLIINSVENSVHVRLNLKFEKFSESFNKLLTEILKLISIVGWVNTPEIGSKLMTISRKINLNLGRGKHGGEVGGG